MNNPFSVWYFSIESVEGAAIVSWREELEDGTRFIKIAVQTPEEFVRAVDRFAKAAKLTWEHYQPSSLAGGK